MTLAPVFTTASNMGPSGRTEIDVTLERLHQLDVDLDLEGTLYMKSASKGRTLPEGHREQIMDTIQGTQLSEVQFWTQISEPEVRLAVGRLPLGERSSLVHQDHDGTSAVAIGHVPFLSWDYTLDFGFVNDYVNPPDCRTLRGPSDPTNLQLCVGALV